MLNCFKLLFTIMFITPENLVSDNVRVKLECY